MTKLKGTAKTWLPTNHFCGELATQISKNKIHYSTKEIINKDEAKFVYNCIKGHQNNKN